MTMITLDPPAVTAPVVVLVRSRRTAIMAALTELARHTDPMLGHGGLLSEVLEALVRGGMDVSGLIDCVLAELEVRP